MVDATQSSSRSPAASSPPSASSSPPAAPANARGMPGLELGITSNEAFLLKKLPRRILIVGGGYVGARVRQHLPWAGLRDAHRASRRRMLRGFDDDLRAHTHIEVERGGMKLTMKTTLTKLEKAGGAIRATLSTGEKVETDRAVRHRAPSRTPRASAWSAPA